MDDAPPESRQLRVNWDQVARLVLTSRSIDEVQEDRLAPAGRIPYQFSAKRQELAQGF